MPVGFVYGPQDTVVLDPEAQVQRVLRLLFDTYRRTGSLLATVKEFRVAGQDTTVVLGVETAFPDGPIQMNIQGQSATLRLAGSLSGEQVFSLTRGTAVSGTMKGTMKMNLSGGPLGRQGMAISADSDMSLRLR